MKLDFYDLFSLHTPQDVPSEEKENYFTTAVKGRVMENIPTAKCKPLRFGRIGRAVMAAAAVVVVLVTGTLAASALGLIDLEKIFGGMFSSGIENLEGIVAVPQNVVVTGDDRLSFRVLGIGGSKIDYFVAIEIKRNDGGVFPKYMDSDGYGETEGEWVVITEELQYIDETTAICYLRNNTTAGYDNTSDTIVGNTFTYKFSKITDKTEVEKILQKYDARYNNYIDDEDLAYLNYLSENENVVINGGWTVTFPLDYNAEERVISVNEQFTKYGLNFSVITEVRLSAVSLDVYHDEFNGTFGGNMYDAVIKLDSGDEFTVTVTVGTGSCERGKEAVLSYTFYKPIDIDSVESITIGNVVIPVK